MEPLSTLMLAFIVMLLCLAAPRMFADWHSLQKLEQSDEFDDLQKLLTSANFWAQRHFLCALIGICMIVLIDNSALETMAPRLLQMTTVYTCLCLTFAFVETLISQKITVLLSTRQVAIRSHENDPR